MGDQLLSSALAIRHLGYNFYQFLFRPVAISTRRAVTLWHLLFALCTSIQVEMFLCSSRVGKHESQRLRSLPLSIQIQFHGETILTSFRAINADVNRSSGQVLPLYTWCVLNMLTVSLCSGKGRLVSSSCSGDTTNQFLFCFFLATKPV